MTTDAALRAYSGEHLHYEITMLFVVGVLLGHSETPVTVREKVIQNALDESFALHFRVLLDFIFVPTPFRDSVTSDDYVLDIAQWRITRGEPSGLLRSAKTRANKEIAHLTTRRVFYEPQEKSWSVEPILEEMYVLLDRFVSQASADRLHPRILRFLKEYQTQEFRATVLTRVAKAPTDGD